VTCDELEKLIELVEDGVDLGRAAAVAAEVEVGRAGFDGAEGGADGFVRRLGGAGGCEEVVAAGGQPGFFAVLEDAVERGLLEPGAVAGAVGGGEAEGVGVAAADDEEEPFLMTYC
jgi:hypothetical protein